MQIPSFGIGSYLQSQPYSSLNKLNNFRSGLPNLNLELGVVDTEFWKSREIDIQTACRFIYLISGRQHA